MTLTSLSKSSAIIESGEKTDEPIRTRGWQYWHQLFNPRQLLLNGSFLSTADSLSHETNKEVLTLLGINRVTDFHSKLCRWIPANSQTAQTFYNQALNALENFAAKGMAGHYNMWKVEIESLSENQPIPFDLKDARIVSQKSDLWLTDPPYADAVNYHELTEFFLAWDKKIIEKIFSNWYGESKRVLAVKGTGEGFNQSMSLNSFTPKPRAIS